MGFCSIPSVEGRESAAFRGLPDPSSSCSVRTGSSFVFLLFKPDGPEATMAGITALFFRGGGGGGGDDGRKGDDVRLRWSGGPFQLLTGLFAQKFETASLRGA